MKHKILLFVLFAFISIAFEAIGQPTNCPAPLPNTPNCFQTSRPNNGNPLVNWPPIPNQDCCNAIPLCQPLNFIDNGVVVPTGAPAGALFPGCVDQELPSDANTCFSNNEKATTWYKWQIRPLPNGPTAVGAPAGKLRFKIIPLDALADPDYDPFTDQGDAPGYGNTDYDFLLFKIPSNLSNDGQICTRIKNSTAFGTANSVIASCNWTGTRGPTGLFEPGTGTDASAGPAVRFNRPLDVKVGDVFYLAIDNFSVNQQGFYVDFRGLEAPDDSTAIVNPPPDTLISIAKIENPQCASRQFKMIFNRPVRCDSVQANKFTVTGASPNIVITSIQPEGGCNTGGQDTAFIFTISPDSPDTTLKIVVSSEIKDICGNKVLRDTANMRIEFPKPLIFGITGNQPSCGTAEITVQFAQKVYCDSLKPAKFSVLFGNNFFSKIIKIRRKTGTCTPGTLDSIYVFTLDRVIKDSLNLSLALNGLIRDKCLAQVAFDTLAFRVNPFLTAKAEPAAVCPNIPTFLSAKLDSTFIGTSTDSLQIQWTNLNTGLDVENDLENVLFDYNQTARTFRLRVVRNLTETQTVNYRAIVTNLSNGCMDTSYVPVIFAARPDLVEKETITPCFGETFEYKPRFNNARLDQLTYFWANKAAPNDTLSKDSVFSQTVTDTLLQNGINQTYVLKVRYLDSLGGCNSDPQEFKVRYGRKIEPKILIDSSLIYASITPADYTFDNGTTFFPAKPNSRFFWDFGQGKTTEVNGLVPVSTVYPEPGKNGAPFMVKLKAVDTLLINPGLIGKICENRDSILVYVQDLVPSLVTSNRDGKNDFFFIEGMRPNTFEMKLYNRWGKEVGEQNPFDHVVGWDPDKVGPGIYYYILTEKRSGKNKVGWLTITRP
jgi:hypothetical protein